MAGGGLSHSLVYFDMRHRRAVVIIVAAFIAAIFLYSNAIPRSCYDEACFIAYANSCASATFTNRIATATLYYETGGCILNKTVVAMDSYEPEETREDFVGKSMVCVFTKGDFSPLHLTKLSAHLDNCKGELKDSIQNYIFY